MAAYGVRQTLPEPCLRPDGGIRACLTRCGQLHECWHQPHKRTTVPRKRKSKRKRESVSSSNVLASSDAEDDADEVSLTGCTNMTNAHIDELTEYLALPQIENNGEW